MAEGLAAVGEWYWCLKHSAVEPRQGCAAAHRLGPYPTREEASRALDRVQQRNEQWDEEDRRWDGDVP